MSTESVVHTLLYRSQDSGNIYRSHDRSILIRKMKKILPSSMFHVVGASDQAQVLDAPFHASHFSLVAVQPRKKC